MSRRIRNRGAAVAAAIAVSVLAACSNDTATPATSIATSPDTSSPGTATPATTPATTPDTSGVTLKIAYSTENSDTLIRDQSEAFSGTEYSIDWVEFNGSNATLEGLNAGAVDIAVLQSPSAVLSVANAGDPWTSDNAPFQAVAAWDTPDTPGFQLLVHPGSGITSVADLAGKKVAYAKGALGHFFWAKASRDAGLAAGDVEEVVLPAVDGRSAFLAGQVDALVTGNRTAVMLMGEDDATSIAVSRDYTPYYTLTVVRRGLLDDPARAAAVQDYLVRFAAMHEWLAAHPDLLAAVMVEVMEMTEQDALHVAETESRIRVPLADTVEALQEMADVFWEVGAADAQIDVTVLFDTSLDDGATGQT
jgi:sulfonate transport system substrate-binding protein